MRGRFRDIEELTAAVAKWDLDFVQLDAGLAPTDLAQVRAPSLLIQRFRFGAACLQRGASPSGMRTFGLREPEARGARMFGSVLSSSDLTVFQAGGDFEGMSQPDFACLSVSIDETLFEEALEAVNAYRLDDLSETGPRVVSVAPKLAGRMRCRAKQLLDVVEASPSALARSECVEDEAFELAIELPPTRAAGCLLPERALPRTRVTQSVRYSHLPARVVGFAKSRSMWLQGMANNDCGDPDWMFCSWRAGRVGHET
jgi:hypothetical protein